GRDSGRGHPLDLQISRQFFTGLYRAGDLSPPARHHGAQLPSKLCPMIDSDVIASLPKVELHDHLDGGLRPATIVELAAEIGYELPTTDPAELEKWFYDAANSGDLPTYLRSEEHTSELQSRFDLVCRLLLEKK